MSVLEKIKEHVHKKHLPIQDHKSMEIYNLFEGLFTLPLVPEQELEFERLLLQLRTKRQGLHASAILKGEDQFCLREQILSLLYEPYERKDKMRNSLLRIFEEGNYIHRKWQRLFLRGELCKPEDLDRTSTDEAYRLAYSPDAIITIKNKSYIVEIKSMNEGLYKLGGRHSAAEKQLQLYMHLTGIHNGIVLLENKNTQDFKLFLIDFDPQLAAESVHRLQEIAYYFGVKQMPDRIDECSSILCKRAGFCSQRRACFGNKIDREGIRIR